jgi:hypothetical protein
MLTVNQFITYSSTLTHRSRVENPIKTIQNALERSEYGLEQLDEETQMKVGNAFKKSHPGTELDASVNEFLDYFSPLIPDSPLLKCAQDGSSGLMGCLLTLIAKVCLVVEVVLREIISTFVSCGLDLYSFYDQDQSALYQLRLKMNRHRPFNELVDSFIDCAAGTRPW